MIRAVAEANCPHSKGNMGVFEAFFDTLIVCTMTCLAILCSGVWTMEGVDLRQ